MRASLVWRPRAFLRDEGGAVTVEAVLWIPFFFAVLILITDASFAFFGKAQAFRVVEDANRAYSVGRMDDVDAVEDWIETVYSAYSPNAAATTTENGGIVSTTLVIPAADLLMFNSLSSFSDFDITIRAQQFVE